MYDIPYELVLAALVCLFVTVLASRRRRIPQDYRLPPGPRALPLIGNLLDIPSHHQWMTFSRWALEHGDINYVNALGISMVIVNSLDVASDLFEKRSSLYSDRYELPMMMLMGWNWNFAFMKYGTRWLNHRKAFLRGFHPAAVKEYYPIQTKWTQDLLQRLQETPDDYSAHLSHYSGAIIMEVVYGIQVMPEGDPYIKIAEEAMLAGSQAANPGTFLIDILPLLKYVPEWVPGAGFQKKARLWRIPITETVVRPFRAVKEALSTGIAVQSVTTRLLEEASRKDTLSTGQEEVIRDALAIAYIAGSDTTSVALTWFLLAMVLYPDVQRKAQAELDDVVGMTRLPRFDDRQHLPYINALCKEVQRWNPLLPIGIAHQVSQDDIYKDLFIPRGSIVIGNTWKMLHDEKTFGPRPGEFEPERFFKPSVPDPNIAFGYGRRICPGRYMAMNSVFIAVASILKVFNISRARDCHGNLIPVKAVCSVGTIARPEAFQCEITLRYEAAESLLVREPKKVEFV